MSEIKRIEVSIPVTVRKYEVDIDSLKKLLKTHKKNSKLSNKQIAEQMDKPITLVEHWFRGDKSFAIPDSDSWDELKKLLGVETDQFDLSVKTFVEKPGEYDQRNRIYLTDGIAPTLTTGSEVLIMTKINMLGLLDAKGQENTRRVYGIDGIAPCLTTSQGGNRQPKILVGGDEMIIDLTQWRREGTPRIYPDVAPTLQARDYKEPRLTIEGADGMKTLKTNDLFCGAGGMGLGFKQAGFDISGAWDFDKYAVQSYKHNVGDHVQQADISKMVWSDMPQADVWTFGFPCQDLSVAGKQAGLFEGKRSGLFFEVMRLLDETKENEQPLPSIIMAENVKGLKPYLEVLEAEYKQRGYKMYYTLYNSKFWGVPQNRERYFVVGVHESIEKEFIFPTEQKEYIPRLVTILESNVDEKYYIDSEKAKVIIEQAKDKLLVKEATKKGYAEAIEGDSVNLAHPNSKTRRGRVGKQVAQTLLTGQEQAVVEGINTVRNGKEFHSLTEQSVTLCARDYKGPSGSQPFTMATDGLKVRKLTPREYARLQGFPDSFELVVSDSQAYKQFGNAVTVNVAQAIAERIRMFLLSL